MKFHKRHFYRLIGTNIRNARGAMSQKELAEKIGLIRTSVSNIESGKQRLSIAKLFEISFALDVDVYDLLPQNDELVHASKATLPEGLGEENNRRITEFLNNVGVEVEQ